jgi:hypothetical protein
LAHLDVSGNEESSVMARDVLYTTTKKIICSNLKLSPVMISESL